MKTIALGTFLIATAFAGGSGGLLPGNGWCGTQQQPIGTYCQSTAAVVDVARRVPPRDTGIDAGLLVFSHIIVVVEDPKKVTK